MTLKEEILYDCHVKTECVDKEISEVFLCIESDLEYFCIGLEVLKVEWYWVYIRICLE